jgi:hypothetical protein
MDKVKQFVIKVFAVDSIYSIGIRGGIWFGIAFVIIFSSSHTDNHKTKKNLKSNLGFFFVFISLATLLVYMLFGFTLTI